MSRSTPSMAGGPSTSMSLLERQTESTILNAALDRASAGSGAVILVSGEAGIGKTALIEHFTSGASRRSTAPRLLWGACDALFTPRPFGPFHDIAAQGLPDLDEALRDSNRSTLFARAFAILSQVVSVVVVEDVHWADEATLDLVMYLGRRVGRTSVLLIVTYRDDELAPQHPLRNVLGVLASSSATQRIDLGPLSLKAIQTMTAGRGIDAAELRAATGGNPFFIQEALANAASDVPATIRDAVLARVTRLSDSARAVLDAAAVVGPRIEPWLLSATTGAEAPSVDECLALGLLKASSGALVFRHELTRRAVLELLPPHRRLVLHRMILTALQASPTARADAARLTYHAEAADDRAAILAHAPAAGRAAAQAGAYREAAALFALALRYAEDLPAAERAGLYEARADACNHSDDRAGSLQAWREAQAIWQAQGDVRRTGESLAQCASQLNGMGRTDDAERECQAAIDLLETLPAGRELALAYRVLAGLRMLTQDYQSAIEWGEKAVALAQASGASQSAVIVGAENVIASSWMMLDYDRGRQLLERNLRDAHAIGLEHLAGLAYANLSSSASEVYRFTDAERWFHEGSTYVLERGLDRYWHYLLAWRTHTLVRLGRWADAELTASELLGRPNVSVTSRITALTNLGLLRARRGQPESGALLDQALELSRDIHSLHRLGLVRGARAEAAWLAGDLVRARAEAEAVVELAVEKAHPWFAGELLYWLSRAGVATKAPDWLALPYARHLANDWRGAAAAWHDLGCPYEQARALADGDAEAQVGALDMLDRLGAVATAERLRDSIRRAGGVVPRGPRASTRGNAFGLTDRQLEILEWVAAGLTNAEIAQRLHLSAKTVDHHVSAILAKLNVPSRLAAADRAREAGVLTDDDNRPN